jgi:hypothetical protein
VLVEGNGMELDRLAAILQSVAGGGRDAAI